MTFIIPTPEQANAGLRALKTVLTTSGPLDAVRRAGLAAVQKYLLHTDFDIDALASILPSELAEAIEPKALREQLVNGMATMVLASSRVDPLELQAVEHFAEALGVHPSSVSQVRMLMEERILTLRFDIARKGPAGPAIRQLYEDQGLLSLIKNIASFAGIFENEEVASRYRSLKDYPEGSLGRALFDFYTSNNFRFPGEKHGSPETLLIHDLSHILSGNGTDYPGESRTLAFQAGNRAENPFGILVFLLIQINHGVRLTPFAETAVTGLLEEPGLIDDIVRSFARGSRVKKDLSAGWTFWPDLDKPIDAIRERYGIEPWAS